MPTLDLIKYFPELVTNQELLKELEDYTMDLQDAITEGRKLVYNLGEYHAALMMSSMMSLTKSEINMVVGKFDGAISNKPIYVEAFEKCLINKVPINVIFVDEDCESNESSLAKGLLKKYFDVNGNIIMRTATDETRKKLKVAFSNYKEIVHFSVFDNSMYRVESGPKSYTAYGSFDNKSYCQFLLKTYNDIFPTTIEYPI